nr:hypothetical protein WS71_19865 [Burkholderia mayonis]
MRTLRPPEAAPRPGAASIRDFATPERRHALVVFAASRFRNVRSEDWRSRGIRCFINRIAISRCRRVANRCFRRRACRQAQTRRHRAQASRSRHVAGPRIDMSTHRQASGNRGWTTRSRRAAAALAVSAFSCGAQCAPLAHRPQGFASAPLPATAVPRLPRSSVAMHTSDTAASAL